jgi:cytoskeletal protein CcmA (bactofilin family)
VIFRSKETGLQGSAGRSLSGLGWLVGLVLLGLFPRSTAAQSFLPPEAESPVYESYVLAAETSVELFEGLTLTGNVHSNGSLELAAGTSVQGDVGAHSFLTIDGSVSGTAIEGAAWVALPVAYDEVAGRALADRVFEESISFSSDEAVNDIVFVVGNARFAGALTGQGTVIATGDIVVERAQTPAPGASDRLALVALGDLVLEKGRAFRGVLVAQGDIELEEEVSFTGVAISHGRLSVDETVSVTFEDPTQ